MVASLNDRQLRRRPMEGIFYGVLLGALLWTALIALVLAI